MANGYVGASDVARKLVKGYLGIPTSYTPIEYAESSGAQYIDTGYYPNTNTRLEISISLPPIVTGQNYDRPFEAYNETQNTDYFGLMRYGTGSTFYFYLNGNTVVTNLSLTSNTIYDIIATNSYIEANGDRHNFTSVTFNSQYSLKLFRGYDRFGYVKIYSCKIYENNTLVKDFVPTVNDNGVCCLFDKVAQKAYYNDGTSSFSVGNTTGASDIETVSSRRLVKGYVGVGNLAKICFGQRKPTYRTYINDTAHITIPSVTNNDDYILVAGGVASGSMPIKTVTAYDSSLVATTATDMTNQARQMASCYFNGYGILAGGMTGNNGSNRTSQCLAYSNSLTKTGLPDLWTSVYDCTATSNAVHFIVSGGTNYSSGQTNVVSYSTSFTRSYLTNMSGKRSQNASAAVGEYIVCCGVWDGTASTDFYDNSNVKTTTPDAYGKATDNVLGLSTSDYAVFWGGATAYNTGQYSDCRAYDKNKVLFKFNLPAAHWKLQGVYNGEYAFICSNTKSYIYNNSLVLIDTNTESENIYGEGVQIQAATIKGVAIHHKNGTSRLNIIDV